MNDGAGRHKAGWRGGKALPPGAELRRAPLWLPTGLGAGIALYLALPVEPPAWLAALVLLPVAALVSGLARRGGVPGVAGALALAAVAAGFSAAILEARRVAAPVIAAPLTETVDGRVIERSRASSGAPRVTLDRVVIHGLDPRETPARVRIALVGTAPEAAPGPGTAMRVYARLFAPGGPVEPGGFDFRRKAFFEGLGGVGYAEGPVLIVGRAEADGVLDAARLRLAVFRAALADALMAALPGPEGAFAAAIVAGDRSGIEEADAEALRAANLSHLLAISGLHMGILTGLVFVVARLGLAAVPGLALRHPTKKIAAVVAVLAGAAYLAVAGATVATQRAFIMAAVVFLAVLLDRPAISLRALALAAAIILLLHPLSLVDVGFQMSFAATAALVATYEAIARGRWRAWELPRGGPWWRRGARRAGIYLGALVLTSVVAGLATAPFAAYHFNRVAPYGLPANLAAVPAMGLLIAPMAVMAAVAAPFGLARWPLEGMGAGIAWVLAVAEEVASWPGAYGAVEAAHWAVLPAIALGGLWLAIWRGWWRVLGLAPMAAGLVLWAAPAERPAVLIGPGARLVGVMGPEGRAVDHARAQSFAAERWLLGDGAPEDQEVASARPGLEHGRGWARADLGRGWRLEVVHARRPDRARLRALCEPGVVLVARHGGPIEGPCLYLGEAELATGGALAIRMGEAGPRLDWAREARMRRPWLPEAGGAAAAGGD